MERAGRNRVQKLARGIVRHRGGVGGARASAALGGSAAAANRRRVQQSADGRYLRSLSIDESHTSLVAALRNLPREHVADLSFEISRGAGHGAGHRRDSVSSAVDRGLSKYGVAVR